MQAFCNTCKSTVKVACRGSFGCEIVLWLIFFPLGLIYTIWRLIGKKVCMLCKNDNLLAYNTPAAQQAILQQLKIQADMTEEDRNLLELSLKKEEEKSKQESIVSSFNFCTYVSISNYSCYSCRKWSIRISGYILLIVGIIKYPQYIF